MSLYMPPFRIRRRNTFEKVLTPFCIMGFGFKTIWTWEEARVRPVILGSRIMEIRYVTEISGIVHTGILFP